MDIWVYHSELTNRTILSLNNHGETWEMADGEVYDRYPMPLTFDKERCIMIDYDSKEVVPGAEKDLA